MTVSAGECVGVVGPNGAGKSTLLRTAAAITAPSQGRVVCHGRTIAVIEMGAGLHPDLTGRENADLLAAVYEVPSARRSAAVDSALRFAELGDALDQPVRTYSTGMVARLSLAIALHAEPDLLLLDEVLSVGDTRFRERCLDRTRALAAAGVAVVLVTHDLDLVGDLCDRTLLLVGGRLVEDGETGVVLRHYLGVPEDDEDFGDVTIVISDRRRRAGEALRVRVEAPAMAAGSEVQFELILPEHRPIFNALGLRHSSTFGLITVDRPSGTSAVWEIGTEHLPPEQFEVRALILGPEGRMVGRSRRHPFAIEGAAGPTALRLAAAVHTSPRPER